MGKGLVLLAALACAGCATVKPQSHDFCLTAKPIRLLRAEILVLSEESAREIDAHNNYGAALCGWSKK